MKPIYALLIMMVLLAMQACKPSTIDDAQRLMGDIETLYNEGRYQAALDSITALRQRHPDQVSLRQRALTIWQEASLQQAQQDIARTDSALQATIEEMNHATTIRERNRIGMRKDSLQVRYDVLVATVRVIHRRQQQKPS